MTAEQLHIFETVSKPYFESLWNTWSIGKLKTERGRLYAGKHHFFIPIVNNIIKWKQFDNRIFKNAK